MNLLKHIMMAFAVFLALFLLPLWVWALISIIAPKEAARLWDEWLKYVRAVWTGEWPGEEET